MGNFNLLPPEMRPKANVVKLAKKAKKIAIVCVSGLIVVSVFLTAGFVYFSTQLTSAKQTKSELEKEIENLSATEQRLYFVRDRLKKIELIDKSSSAKEELAILQTTLTLLPDNVFFDSAELKTNHTSMTYLFLSSRDMTKLLSQISSQGYSRIEMLSFSFKKVQGFYEMELGVVN
jgi:phosphoenolpyruvate-protein kinase (PTS system EI component)